MSRNLVLFGMMGAGKTTVAERLAARLGRRAVDSDDEIVSFVDRDIPTIFDEAGEAYFRAVEHQVIRQLARADDLVIALGGGAVLSDANVAELLLTGVLIELRASREVLIERLSDAADGRPLLAGRPLEDEVDRLLGERSPRYAEVADLTVDADRPPDEVVEQILTALQDRDDVLTPSEHEQVMP